MFISQQISKNIVDILVENHTIEENKREIYIYCYDYIIEQILYTAIQLTIAALMHELIISCLFILMFFPMRYYGGGIHAPTERSCVITSSIVYLAILFLAPVIAPYHSILWFFAFILSCAVIIILAPVDTPNKRLNRGQKKHMKKNCVLYCIFFSLMFIILFYSRYNLYYGTLAICAILIAISMLLGALTNRLEARYDTENCNM